jgi:hypothetical protein
MQGILFSIVIIILIISFGYFVVIDQQQDLIQDKKLQDLIDNLKLQTTQQPLQKLSELNNLQPTSDNTDFIQVGFIYNEKSRFPLFSRNKFPNKSDKKEYYILDELKLKIPFNSTNDNELYDNDTVIIKELNNTVFKVELYTVETLKYNPQSY